MLGIDSFNTTPILSSLNMPSHSFTLHTENAKTFLAPQTESELLEGYVPAKDEGGYAYVLQSIQSDYCPDMGADEACSAGPFTQFTIRGHEGDANDGRWHWGNGGQSLFIHDWDGDQRSDIGKSGAVEIDIRDGYTVKLQIELTDAKQGKDFKDDHWGGWGTNDTNGVISKGELTTIVLMTGGDKLSIDIDDDWAGTTNFYLKVQGEEVAYSSGDKVNDDVKITLLGVWKEGAGEDNNGGGDNGDNGGNNGNNNGGSSDSGGMGIGTIALVGAGVVGLVLLLK